MQIVWDKKAVERLKNTHTILELETFEVNGEPIATYCVIPAEKIGLDGFSKLESLKALHAAFIEAYKEKNYKLCRDAAEHLIGAFSGEVDSFYQEILSRFPPE
jgi:hypothetical protein